MAVHAGAATFNGSGLGLISVQVAVVFTSGGADVTLGSGFFGFGGFGSAGFGDSSDEVLELAGLQAEFATLDSVVHAQLKLDSAFTWSGTAVMEFVGSTDFIDLLKSSDAVLAFSAEVHLRSL